MSGVEILYAVAATAGAAGAVGSAQAAKRAANANAATNSRNADFAIQQGEMNVAQVRRESLLRQSSIRAAAGEAGLGQEGSPMDVLASTVAQGERDVQNIRYNASMKALGYRESAALDRSRAHNADTAGYLGAAASLGQGAAKMYGASNPGTGNTINVNSDYGSNPEY